ncbi:hypothetical protein CIB84_000583, partial [Bambusicola thoracicus]
MLSSEPRSGKFRSQKPVLLYAIVLKFYRYDRFPGKAKLPEGVNIFFFCIQDDGPSEDKNRPNSDPGPHQAQSHLPQGVFQRLVSTTNKTALDLLSLENRLTCRNDRLHSPPKSLENTASPSNLEADTDVKLPESTTQQLFLKRRQNSSPLSVVQLSILLSQITDKTQLQELDILVPLADINNYLKLTEAAGQICVSQWTGPCRLGCLFNHGDRIVAVNGLHPQNMEEASLFISRSTQKE